MNQFLARINFQLANVGVLNVSPEGLIIEANVLCCQMFGLSREELIGMTVDSLTYNEDRDRTKNTFARMNSGEIDRFSSEKRYLRSDGNYFWASLDTKLIRDSNGRPNYYISVVRDISSQKNAPKIAAC